MTPGPPLCGSMPERARRRQGRSAAGSGRACGMRSDRPARASGRRRRAAAPARSRSRARCARNQVGPRRCRQACASGTRKRSTRVTGELALTFERCASGGSGSPIARPATCVSRQSQHGEALLQERRRARVEPHRQAPGDTAHDHACHSRSLPAAASTRTVAPGPGTSTDGVAASAACARAETVTTRAARASSCNALRMTQVVSRFAGTYTA